MFCVIKFNENYIEINLPILEVAKKAKCRMGLDLGNGRTCGEPPQQQSSPKSYGEGPLNAHQQQQQLVDVRTRRQIRENVAKSPNGCVGVWVWIVWTLALESGFGVWRSEVSSSKVCPFPVLHARNTHSSCAHEWICFEWIWGVKCFLEFDWGMEGDAIWAIGKKALNGKKSSGETKMLWRNQNNAWRKSN